MRLGVSPTAASTPTGVFNQRFEALFPRAGALGCAVCFAPLPFLPVYLCVNVEPQGLPAAAWPAPFHNLPPYWQIATSPLRPSCPSALPLLVWMNVLHLLGCPTSIQSDFLSVLVVRGGAVCLPTLPSWFSIFRDLDSLLNGVLLKLKYHTDSAK